LLFRHKIPKTNKVRWARRGDQWEKANDYSIFWEKNQKWPAFKNKTSIHCWRLFNHDGNNLHIVVVLCVYRPRIWWFYNKSLN
jgi:hypothetical protein